MVQGQRMISGWGAPAWKMSKDKGTRDVITREIRVLSPNWKMI